MQVIIDRFEQDEAIVEIEEGVFSSIPKILIPDAEEGDVIDIIINKEDTKKRKEKITGLVNNLFE